MEQREELVRFRRGLREGEVRGAPVCGRRGGVHGAEHQRAAEAKAALAAGEQVGQGPVDRGGARAEDEFLVRVLLPRRPRGGGRGQRQAAGVVGQTVAGHLRQHLTGDQRRGQRPTPAQLGRRQTPYQGEQQRGVALGRRDQFLPDGGVDGLVRGVPDQQGRVRGGERAEAQHGQVRQLGGDAAMVGDGHQEGRPHARPPDARGGAGERGACRRVPEVGVVHAQEDGGGRRGRPEGVVQLVRLIGTEVPHRSRAEEAGGVVEERGAAATGFTGHDADAAVGTQRVQQLGGQPLTRGRVSGHLRDLTHA